MLLALRTQLWESLVAGKTGAFVEALTGLMSYKRLYRGTREGPLLLGMMGAPAGWGPPLVEFGAESKTRYLAYPKNLNLKWK